MIEYQVIKTNKIQLETSIEWIKKVVHLENKTLGDIVFVFCNDDYLLEKN